MEQYLTTDEVAEIRRMEKVSLEQERFRGDGPPYISNKKKVLYPKSLFEKWMREQIITPKPAAKRERVAS